jgi:hypothetical protein
MVYCTMKRLTLLLIFLSAVFSLMSQSPCGHNHMVLNDVEADSAFARRILPGITYSRSSFEQKTIPVIVHIFHEGEEYGEGSHLTQEVVIGAIDRLNQVFSGLTEDDNNTFIDFCISNETLTGAQAFGILYHDLNDYTGYDGSLGNITNNNLYVDLQNAYSYSVSNYMEIFVAPWTSGYAGFTSTPPSNLGVWIRTTRFGSGPHITSSSGQTTTLEHEVGHWCGLLHTFSNGSFSNYESCDEAQSESNCESQGDYVCDTEPTPVSGNCINDCGNDIGNMMSYHPGTCRTGFTIGQIERMHERVEFFRQQINNDFCDGTETGCIDSEACNYDIEALYDDGSCEYADPGFDCEGNPVVSVQELVRSDQVKGYTYYDIQGRIVNDETTMISGIYMLSIEYFNGSKSVTKVYIDRR